VAPGSGDGAGGSGSTAPTQTLTVGSPGASASMPFDGTAGQRVYIEVTATTLPDSCGVPELVQPGGITVALGCIHGGRGFLDGTLLTVTGRYQIVIKPGGNVTGTITLRVITSTDAVAPITATVSAAGQQARLTFTAPTDEKVFVDILGSTLPIGCGGINLARADGSDSALGCTEVGGRGFIDTTALKAGSYIVRIDPAEAATGSATVRLTVVEDQRQSIVLNGGSVSATVAEAGATSRLTFSASAGQKITVDGTGATLPPDCGQLLLLDPAGTTVDLGCTSADHTATMGPTTLKATGTYTTAGACFLTDVAPAGRVGRRRVDRRPLVSFVDGVRAFCFRSWVGAGRHRRPKGGGEVASRGPSLGDA
jgi:hypothetical protein